MKIRQGFVSNSSASSFLIYGISVDKHDAEEYFKDKLVDNIELWQYFKRNNIKLEIEGHSEYDDNVYFGLSLKNIQDDETGKEFKERVKKELEKVFDKYFMRTLGIHEEAYSC